MDIRKNKIALSTTCTEALAQTTPTSFFLLLFYITWHLYFIYAQPLVSVSKMLDFVDLIRSLVFKSY